MNYYLFNWLNTNFRVSVSEFVNTVDEIGVLYLL